MLPKNVSLQWSREVHSSFESLKKRLTSAPAYDLVYLKFPTYVTTDASKSALEAMIQQDFPYS